MSFRRRIQSVRRAGTGQPGLVVGGLDVVEQLVLGSAPIDMIIFFGAAVEDAAVAGLADLPFEFKFEVAELLFRNEIAHRRLFRKRAVDDVPAHWNCVCLVATPGIHRGAVEQHLPGCLGLLSLARHRERGENQKRVEDSHQSPLLSSYFTPRCSSASEGQPFQSASALFPIYCRSSTPILLDQNPLAVRSRKLLKKAAADAKAGTTFPGYAMSSRTLRRSASAQLVNSLSNRSSHK